ncbi:MAG TPA: DUF6282 family protein [Gammaproteobacteria bacterium]|nr:DUF6282 family protein [Gammaproteobacteria bacterium]
MRPALLPLWCAALLGAASPVGAQLQGMIDLHVHAAPDSIARSIDAFETARMARRQGMRAMLFKSHYTETASLAYLVSQAVPGIEVYGGIALNRSVGGLNPVAVERMAMMTGGLGRVVWLPTFDSEHNHLTVAPNPNHVPIARNGELLPEVFRVLAVLAERNLALATGHSSPEESLLVIRAAKAAGIDRIIVTHPSSRLVRMSLDGQKQAARLGALLEYPVGLALPSAELPFDELAAQIREVGPENVVVSTDLGQVGNPVHTDGLLSFLPRFAAAGFTQAEIDVMTKRNPARLLALE